MSARAANAEQQQQQQQQRVWVSPSMSLEPLPSLAVPSQCASPLRFHPPTCAPHLRLQPDHLTVTHVGPGNHSSDHSLLHSARPLVLESQPSGVLYFEVKLLSAGKRGELYVGLATGDSPAIDPQLVAAIRRGKLGDGAHNRRAGADLARAEEEQPEGEEDDRERYVSGSTAAATQPTDRFWFQQPTASQPQPAASLSQPSAAAALSATPYSSSAQRQLGLEHPHSFAIQLTHGKLFSMQHSKGLSCLPPCAVGDIFGIGYVHNALTSTAVSSAAAGVSGGVAAVTAGGSSAQPLTASSLIVSSYVFFTRNGRQVADKELNMDHINALLAQSNLPFSTSPSPLTALLFPAVSFHSPSESIQAIFEPSAFLFDVAQYEAELRDRRLQLLAAVEDGKSGLLSLVREYLLWWGYDGTVAALDESEVVEVDARLKWLSVGGGGGEAGKSTVADKLVATSESGLRRSLRVRGRIRQLIQSADVEAAVRQIRHHCPAVLRQPTVRFHLHSLHFVNTLTTQPTPAAQQAAPPLLSSSSPVLAALQYGRRHMSRFLHSASLAPTLASLMALLAMSPAQWSGSGLTGLEWRERVADIVNTAILQHLAHAPTHSISAPYNGDSTRTAAADSDTMDDGEERMEKREKGESQQGGGDRRSEAKNGMDVEADELFGAEDSDSEQHEVAADSEDEADSELHGSQLELLLAQLLAVNSLWQHQRPSLSTEFVLSSAALEQLLMPR